MQFWQTSRRRLPLDRTVVMAILNVTPDSFSDGGRFVDVESAVLRAAEIVGEGADIIDIGGESTRPGSARVDADVEIGRVVPVISAVRERFDIPVSVDTTKASVANAAVAAGAEIINDVSGLRFDERIAAVAAEQGAGLVLMHSRGEFAEMHTLPPINDMLADVSADFERSSAAAAGYGVGPEQIVLDIGIGFGKTLDQNLELIANLDKLAKAFPKFPLLVGASRKSFIGKILGGVEPAERLSGSLAAAALAAWNGAGIVRVHDVKETVDCVRIADAIRNAGGAV